MAGGLHQQHADAVTQLSPEEDRVARPNTKMIAALLLAAGLLLGAMALISADDPGSDPSLAPQSGDWAVIQPFRHVATP